MRIRFGEFEMDSETRLVLKAGARLSMTPKAFQLLEVLIRRRPAVVSKHEIFAVLWPKTFVSEANVANLISEIRTLLNDRARHPRYVRTAHGAGYAFCATAIECGRPPLPPPGPLSTCSLVGESGTFPLVEGDQVLGRGKDCEVALARPTVSRHHARIHVRGVEAVIEDLGSRNGTFVRGLRVSVPEPLVDDDEVSIGGVRLRFRVFDPNRTTDGLPLPLPAKDRTRTT
jgi:DNA-binding winged helix-turn-helix (wHTH) protein